MNSLSDWANVFDGITPWAGQVPRGYLVDFLQTLTDARFLIGRHGDPSLEGGNYTKTELPTIGSCGEGWFEAVNWFAAAREAKDRFVMMSLGACYGAQAVGSYKALMAINPMPCKLVVIEPEPSNIVWASVRSIRPLLPTSCA